MSRRDSNAAVSYSAPEFAREKTSNSDFLNKTCKNDTQSRKRAEECGFASRRGTLVDQGPVTPSCRRGILEGGSIHEGEDSLPSLSSRRISSKYNRPLRRGSLWTASSNSLAMNKSTTKYSNTYQLGPTDKFAVPKSLQEDYERILEEHLSGVEYSHHRAVHLSKSVSDAIKARSKLAHSSRYKIIVHVTIVERSHTDAVQSSRCVWNTDTDLSCTMEYQNQSIYASISVFAIYNE